MESVEKYLSVDESSIESLGACGKMEIFQELVRDLWNPSPRRLDEKPRVSR